jgi:hypothetical protein
VREVPVLVVFEPPALQGATNPCHPFDVSLQRRSICRSEDPGHVVGGMCDNGRREACLLAPTT